MDHRAIQKARSRLRNAKAALTTLDSTKDFIEFADSWSLFLVSWKGIYTVLEQGSKTSPQSQQWFGAKKRIRRNDQLLQYMFEARNDDEHGLEISVTYEDQFLQVGMPEPGESEHYQIGGGPIKGKPLVIFGRGSSHKFMGSTSEGITVTSLDGKPIPIRSRPSRAALTEVNARGRPNISPPREHLSKALVDLSPLEAANLVYIYATELVDEAASKV